MRVLAPSPSPFEFSHTKWSSILNLYIRNRNPFSILLQFFWGDRKRVFNLMVGKWRYLGKVSKHVWHVDEEGIDSDGGGTAIRKCQKRIIHPVLLPIFFFLVLVLLIWTESLRFQDESDVVEDVYWNNRPIIGVLAQEIFIGEGHQPTTSYIAASYVKWIEGGGGRVAPIRINQTEEYYKNIFKGINGILFPGGTVYFDEIGGYGSAGRILLSLARSANDLGDYFPVWGTCLGFEFLVYDELGRLNVLEACDGNNITSNLQFTKDLESSRMFGRASPEIIRLFAGGSLTANFHSWCLTVPVIQEYPDLEESYKFLSWSVDGSVGGTRFVSSMEHVNYPFFGVQFHPEKNSYEWSAVKAIPHTREAVRAGQYLAEILVNQGRKSRHSFGIDEEEKHLIYNWNVNYTGGTKGKGSFQQIYYFPI